MPGSDLCAPGCGWPYKRWQGCAHLCGVTWWPTVRRTYDPDERKAFSNGIWLCAIHADEIDRDVSNHSVKVLKEWKRQAEAAAKSELGQQLPKASDATDLLAMTFTGMSKQFLPNAIRQVHQATAQALAAADPRFDITTRYDPVYGTSFQVNARENVKLAMLVCGSDAQVAANGYAAMVEKGHAFELDVNNISIQGSGLFEMIEEMVGKGGGKLRFSQRPVEVVMKLSATDPVTGRRILLDDMPGSLTSGSKSYYLHGTAMNGLLTLSADANHNGESSKINLLFCTEDWISRDVNQLRWFNKIAPFIEAVTDKWVIDLTVELEGEPISGMTLDLYPEEFMPLAHMIAYIRMARTLSDFLKVPIHYRVDFSFTPECYIDLKASVDNIGGYDFDMDTITFPIIGTVVIDASDADKFVGHRFAFENIETFELKQVEVFGQPVKLPRIKKIVKNGYLELIGQENGHGSIRIYSEPGMSVYSCYESSRTGELSDAVVGE